MPDSVLSAEDTTVNKTGESPWPQGIYILAEEITIIKNYIDHIGWKEVLRKTKQDRAADSAVG